MAEPTKAELLTENEQLRARIDELEHEQGVTSGTTRRPVPTLPSFTLSQGTVNDILRARDELAANPRQEARVVVEPFTGRAIHVTKDVVRWDGGDGEELEVPGLPRAETTFDDAPPPVV
jgi:hypothetical protein